MRRGPLLWSDCDVRGFLYDGVTELFWVQSQSVRCLLHAGRELRQCGALNRSAAAAGGDGDDGDDDGDDGFRDSRMLFHGLTRWSLALKQSNAVGLCTYF